MKKLFFLVILSSFFYSCQESNKKPLAKKIEIGAEDSLFSKALNEQRKIWVHVPTPRPHTAKSTYPVLYLLDGDAHFSSVVGMIEQLTTVNGNMVCPEMIIVGITNTDRTRDLTPTSSDGLGSKGSPKVGGGAGNFTKFIETELIPYIDKSYPTTPHRIIVGHSLGGLFVINTLLKSPGLFTNYIAIDPSLWWDNSKLLHETVGQLKGEKYKSKSLFVGIANTMKPGMKLSEARTDTSRYQKHIISILDFVEKTKLESDGSLQFESKYYENDSHGSVPLIATYDAIRYLYSWHDWKEVDKLFDVPLLPIDSAVKAIKDHYRMVSAKIGYEVLPDENMINALGRYHTEEKRYDYAYVFLKMNTDNYPTSARAFDSMGDLYLSKGDTVQAVETFKKVLSIADVPQTKEKLDKLTKK